ncbi:hypothetical protein JZ751_008909 [Albula glossodonta]|uniref:Uncharacterized protein n=1 Tax=Albula glossodonta TaxID=121402 RepID=A0A8T2NZI6_9TELE|nr:hypothetical protein JZ751_008909 [Albula glossodonta]
MKIPTAFTVSCLSILRTKGLASSLPAPFCPISPAPLLLTKLKAPVAREGAGRQEVATEALTLYRGIVHRTPNSSNCELTKLLNMFRGEPVLQIVLDGMLN